MSSRRNGGEGQEVRRETLTGGEELLHRTAEESRDRTRPARAKTELVLISVSVRRWEECRVTPRERVNQRLVQALIYRYYTVVIYSAWCVQCGNVAHNS